MKKVVIAIDSFKGSLSSAEANTAAAEGIKEIYPACETLCLPVSDGGEGILDVLVTATQGNYISLQAHAPHMKLISTCYGISGNGQTALIEMARISGLSLVPPEFRNPMETSSYGIGECIRDALNRGCRKFIVGIGGSATNDAGTGMLQALGFRFYDSSGRLLGTGGKILTQVASIDCTTAHPALKESCFTVLCDVHNPFYGPEGAAAIFAPQKGADENMVRQLDQGMQSIAGVIQSVTGKDIAFVPGAGAAGGTGGCFLAFFTASLQPGIHYTLDLLKFSEKIRQADLIITGEGRADRQTSMGKVAAGILEAANQQDIPVILIAGSVADIPLLNRCGFQGVFSVLPGPVDIEQAMDPHFTQTNIRNLLSQLCKLLRSQQR